MLGQHLGLALFGLALHCLGQLVLAVDAAGVEELPHHLGRGVVHARQVEQADRADAVLDVALGGGLLQASFFKQGSAQRLGHGTRQVALDQLDWCEGGDQFAVGADLLGVGGFVVGLVVGLEASDLCLSGVDHVDRGIGDNEL